MVCWWSCVWKGGCKLYVLSCRLRSIKIGVIWLLPVSQHVTYEATHLQRTTYNTLQY